MTAMNMIRLLQKIKYFHNLKLFKLNLSHVHYSVFNVEKGSETNEKTFQRNNSDLLIVIALHRNLFPSKYRPLKIGE